MEWVTIKKCVELSGYTRKAIENKKGKGIWKQGKHWVKAPDGRILINIQAIQSWITGGY